MNKKISAAQPVRRAEKTGTAQYIRCVSLSVCLCASGFLVNIFCWEM